MTSNKRQRSRIGLRQQFSFSALSSLNLSSVYINPTLLEEVDTIYQRRTGLLVLRIVYTPLKTPKLKPRTRRQIYLGDVGIYFHHESNHPGNQNLRIS